MSSSVPSETDAIPRRKWPIWWPFAALVVALLLIVAIPGAKSIPDDGELPVTPLSSPSLDPAIAKSLRETLWYFDQQWFGPECVFDSDRVGTGSVPFRPFEMRYAIVTPDTIEIHTLRFTRIVNGVPSPDVMRTEMVLVTKFDPEGGGTLDAVSIEWDEDKKLALQKIEAGDCRKGCYVVNDKTMAVYLARQGDPRPTVIPGLIEYDNILARHPAGSPIPTPESHSMDSVLLRVHRLSDEQLPLHMQDVTEELSVENSKRIATIKPLKTPFERSDGGSIRNANGWIVQVTLHVDLEKSYKNPTYVPGGPEPEWLPIGATYVRPAEKKPESVE